MESHFQYDFFNQGQNIILKIIDKDSTLIRCFKLMDMPDSISDMDAQQFKQTCRMSDINLIQKHLHIKSTKVNLLQQPYEQGKKPAIQDSQSNKSTKQSANKQQEEQVKIQEEIKKKRARKNRRKPRYTEPQNQQDEKSKKKKGKKKTKSKIIAKSKKVSANKGQKGSKKGVAKSKSSSKAKAKADNDTVVKQQDEVKQEDTSSNDTKKTNQKASRSKTKSKDKNQNKTQNKSSKSKKPSKSKGKQQSQKIKIEQNQEQNIKIEQMIEPLSDDEDYKQNEKKVEQKQKKKVNRQQRLKDKQENQRRIDEKLKKLKSERTQRKVIEELERQAKKDKIFFSKYGANFTIKIDTNCKHYDQYKIGKGQIQKKGKLYCQIYNQAPVPAQGRHYFAFKIIRLTFRSVTVGLITSTNFQEQYSRDKKNCICFDAYTHSTYIDGQKTEILYEIKINDVVRTVVDIPGKMVIWYVNNELIGDAIIPEHMINQPLYPYIEMSNKWIKIRFDQVQE